MRQALCSKCDSTSRWERCWGGHSQISLIHLLKAASHLHSVVCTLFRLRHGFSSRVLDIYFGYTAFRPGLMEMSTLIFSGVVFVYYYYYCYMVKKSKITFYFRLRLNDSVPG